MTIGDLTGTWIGHSWQNLRFNLYLPSPRAAISAACVFVRMEELGYFFFNRLVFPGMASFVNFRVPAGRLFLRKRLFLAVIVAMVLSGLFPARSAPVHLVEEPPVQITT